MTPSSFVVRPERGLVTSSVVEQADTTATSLPKMKALFKEPEIAPRFAALERLQLTSECLMDPSGGLNDIKMAPLRMNSIVIHNKEEAPIEYTIQKIAAEFLTAALIAGTWCAKSITQLNPFVTGGVVGAANSLAYCLIESQLYHLFNDDSWCGWAAKKVVQMIIAVPLSLALYSGYALATGLAFPIATITLVTAVSSLAGSILNSAAEAGMSALARRMK